MKAQRFSIDTNALIYSTDTDAGTRPATGFQAKADDMPAGEIAKEMSPKTRRGKEAHSTLRPSIWALDPFDGDWPEPFGPDAHQAGWFGEGLAETDLDLATTWADLLERYRATDGEQESCSGETRVTLGAYKSSLGHWHRAQHQLHIANALSSQREPHSVRLPRPQPRRHNRPLRLLAAPLRDQGQERRRESPASNDRGYTGLLVDPPGTGMGAPFELLALPFGVGNTV